jgi:anti-sigma factor RsiW
MDDRELLIRYREGDLPEAEAAGVEERIRNDPGLRLGLERLETVATALEQGAVRSFEPFFATRVMARVGRSEAPDAVEGMYEALRWLFARVVVACLVVILGVGVYSALAGGYGGSVVDSMLGLPDATLVTALALGG